MKISKLISVALFVAASNYAAVASSAALSATAAAINSTVNDTTSQKITVTAIGSANDRASRTGFVKNDFEVTISATVQVWAADNGKALAVGSGSSKGRAVFTGHSNGGSVGQCGDLSASSSNAVANLSATRVDITKRNACQYSSGS